jgi:hypothetical protein
VPVARDRRRNLTLWRLDLGPRLAYGTTGVYPDTWTGPTATVSLYVCDGMTTVVLEQDRSLFPRPQTVVANGRRFVVHGTRTISVPSCRLHLRVTPTKVAGAGDTRELGIHLRVA